MARRIQGKPYIYQFIINKGYDKGWRWTARWRGTQDKGWEGSQAQELLFPLSWGYASSGHGKRSPTQKLFKPHPLGIFPEALLHRHDWLLTPSSAPLPSPEDGDGADSSKPLSMTWSIQLISPHPEAKSTSRVALWKQKMRPGNSKGFGYSVSETRDKDRVLEQKMFLASSSLRKLHRFEELWPGARDENQNICFLLHHSTKKDACVTPSLSGSWSTANLGQRWEVFS